MPIQTVDADDAPREDPGPMAGMSFRDRLAAGARHAEGSAIMGKRIGGELERRAYSAGYAQALLDVHRQDRDGVATFLAMISAD
jgi:hypothetical protein